MPTSEELIVVKQVRELYTNLGITNLSNLIIGLFLMWFLWPAAEHSILITWYSYIALIATVRYLLFLKYTRNESNDGSVYYWLSAYIYGVLASGSGWGLTLIFLVPTDSILYLLSNVFIVCGLVTGSAASLSSLRYGFFAFSIPALLPAIIYLAILDKPYSVTISIALSLFFIFITFIALRIHKTILYGFKRQFENANLLAKIEEEKECLIKEKMNLEKKVERSEKVIIDLKKSLKSEIYNHISTIDTKAVQLNKFPPLLNTIDGGAWNWNIKSGKTEFSDGWLRMLGYSDEDVKPCFSFWESIIHPDEKFDILNKLRTHTDGLTSICTSTHRLKTRSGRWLWVFGHAHVVAWDSYGEALELIWTEINMADSSDDMFRPNISYSQRNAYFYNPNEFKQRLHRVLETTTYERNIEHVLLCIKVDVPEALIRHTQTLGDDILCQLGKLIVRKSRRRDSLVNIKNNIICILLENCAVDVAWKKAKILRNLVSEYNFYRENKYYKLGISIGINRITAASNNVDNVMNEAEVACDIARNEILDRIYIFQKEDSKAASCLFEKQTHEKMLDAINNKKFQLVHTPFKSLVSTRIESEFIFKYELKLVVENDVLLSAVDYMSVVDKNNLSIEVDLHFIKMFCMWATEQPNIKFDKQSDCLIGLSGASITSKEFIWNLGEIYSVNKPAIKRLCFGIPEDILISNFTHVAAFINEIKPYGCKFQIEDFGLRSIALNHMQDLSIDYLKIDSSLINSIEKDAGSLSTVKYINEISHIKNIKTIVSDVNDEHLLMLLKNIKVDYVQGLFIPHSKPVILRKDLSEIILTL